jgi:hypothetical protein
MQVEDMLPSIFVSSIWVAFQKMECPLQQPAIQYCNSTLNSQLFIPFCNSFFSQDGTTKDVHVRQAISLDFE